MKKILFCFLFFTYLFIPNITGAKFRIEDIPPECLINGVTIIQTGYNASDTSRWYMPKAYDGECQSVPLLGSVSKEKIFEFVDNFFRENNMYRIERSYLVLNLQGQDLVLHKLFPAIQVQIRQEIQKKYPDYKKIAMYNYVADIVGYDFQIKQPGE